MGCCGCLTFVSHEIWRILKFILAALAFVGAVVTFFNVVCNVLILREVVAAVLVFAALFMMIDSAGVEAVLNKFRLEISRLHGEVDKLEAVERELTQTSANLKRETELFSAQNQQYLQQLKQSTTLLAQEQLANQAYLHNNAQLAIELQKLQDNNRTLDTTTQAQKIQIQRLLLIEQNAERMISSLMQAGDNFEHFGEIISKSVHDMDDTNTAMERLLKELTKDKFITIDENRDGVITEQELSDYAKRRE